MIESHQEIEAFLLSRIENLREIKSQIKEKIDSWENKLKETQRCAGNPPKESEQQLQQQIAALERIHSTTSQSKSEERIVLREIELLKQRKKSSATYSKFSEQIDELRKSLKTARIELLGKEEALNELLGGLRKVRLAARAGCNSVDLLEKTFNVANEKIPLIIGKGGMNIHVVEESHSVSVDIDHIKALMRIVGLPNAIEKAHADLCTLMDTISEEISVSAATMAVLVMDRHSLVNRLQEEHSVQIDPNVSGLVVRLHGLSRAVTAAKKFIASIPSAHYELKIEKSCIPMIVGKGGTNIRALTTDLHVQLNISREDGIIEILGLKTDVTAATQRLREMVDDSREVEDSFLVERHIALGCLFSSLRTVSKDWGVKIDADRNKDDKFITFNIKGAKVKVRGARRTLQESVDVYRSHTVSLEVDDEVIPAILGKSGVNIKSIREKYPGCHIDLQGNMVFVHCSDLSGRVAILDELHAIVGENFVESIDTDEEFAIMLKSARAIEFRDAIVNKLGLRFTIDKSNRSVKLKGLSQHVRQAVEMIHLLQKSYVVQTFTLSEEDFPFFFKNGDNCIVRKLSNEYNVDITANRKDSNFSIRGHPSNVEHVLKTLQGILDGDEQYGSALLSLDESVSANFIGKSGSNVKKMEEELKVSFDLLKSRSLLRIRGEREDLSAAKIAVTSFLFASRVSVHIPLTTVLEKVEREKLSRRMHDIFSAELDFVTETNSLTLRCAYQVINEAKSQILEETSGIGEFLLPLLSSHIVELKNMTGEGLSKFRKRFSVQISGSAVKFSGNASKLEKAKQDIMRTIHALFPRETAFIELPRCCLRDIVCADLLVETERVGAILQCDRAAGFLWMVCPAMQLTKAQIFVEQALSRWKGLNALFPIKDFMVPLLLGKSGSSISTLRKELECNINLDRTSLFVHVNALTTVSLQKAMQHIDSLIAMFLEENCEMKMHPSIAPLFIGKQGSNINKFRSETGVSVDVDKDGIVRLHGAKENIIAAQQKLQQFIDYEEKFRTLPRSFHLPSGIIPIFIGPKGAAIRAMQETTGAKIDLDRDSKKCTLRGRNEDCENAFKLINALLTTEGYKSIPLVDDVDEDGSDSQSDREDENVIEKSSSLQHKNTGTVAKSNLSKSALKRLRKKERELIQIVNDPSSNFEDLNAENVEDVVSHPCQNVQVANDISSIIFEETFKVGTSNPPIPQVELAQVESNPHRLVEFLLGNEPIMSTPFTGKGPIFGASICKEVGMSLDNCFSSAATEIHQNVSFQTTLPSKSFVGAAPPGLVASKPAFAPSIGITSYRTSSSSIPNSILNKSFVEK